MKKNLLLSFFVFLTACGGNDNHSNSTNNLTFEKSGTLTISDPGTDQVNIDYLASNIPAETDADFTVELGHIVSPEGGIDILEESESLTMSLDNDTIVNELGLEIEPLANGLSESANILQTTKLVIYVNNDRAIALYKTDSHVGGIDRHQY